MEAFFVGLLAATLTLTTPILFPALGELFAERSGVFNLGLEGMMLVGALAGFVGDNLTGSLAFGLLVALGVGALMGAVTALLVVTCYANQGITGVIFNILGLGATGYVYRLLYGSSTLPPQVQPLAPVNIPVLSGLPWIGPILFQQTPLVYISVALVPLAAAVLMRTDAGLRIRAVGGYPRAADSMGIDVRGVRYATLIICGMMASLGGATLSLQLGLFADDMTASRGFIALAIVMVARWQAWGILGGALLFGFADSLQLRLQAIGVQVHYEFLTMLPYLLTIVVLVLSVRRGILPAIIGEPYVRE